ncbi:ABC transporter ATP-binding protein [Desulfofalx alkaliphila]|uniref:ABC transporter ATP-binding protein n=1 Tax=Desulfofalx alkaliphila TaxID=105483 RepID=UPI0004E0E237|nr:ABC transporter ATP-binding protein [Desulfofalx alkaliphila]
MRVIECSGLTKEFGPTKAVNSLSFTIEHGKITGLIGRNGAGKTTLLKLIAGYLLPSAGSVKVFEEDPFNSLKVSANMIFIDENMALPESMNLIEILESAGSFYKNWDDKLAMGLFEYFNLNPKQYHKNLSKGMKSTFNAIIGISARCPLTIFDEPTTGMDAAVRKDFYRALLKDFMHHPRTVILSSHHINEINDILSDLLLLKNGEKLLHTSVDRLTEYALGLQGKGDVIAEMIKNTEVFYRKKIGKDSLYVAVRNQYSLEELQRGRLRGVEISPVATEDLCVYLTDKHNGGIDDVFGRD